MVSLRLEPFFERADEGADYKYVFQLADIQRRADRRLLPRVDVAALYGFHRSDHQPLRKTASQPGSEHHVVRLDALFVRDVTHDQPVPRPFDHAGGTPF